MLKSNGYLFEISLMLPRLLALFDVDPTSPTYGVGDRAFWAWKTTDFANGTFQGAANGLARLRMAGLLPEKLSVKSIDSRISACFLGAERLRRRDGSLEEAFPHESSYCVTALVAYDLLTSIELQTEILTNSERERRLAILAPMIHFLLTTDETHGFISNHLATAAVTLYKWHSMTGEASREGALSLLNRILKSQRAEGWYEEYGGADPGYQTLCIYYMADFFRIFEDSALKASLQKAVRFLWHFAHPDGSFGGVYGRRHTRLFCPAGIQYLAALFPEAAALSDFMARSIGAKTTVTLSVLDDPNLIPMFNAYSWSATQLELGQDENPSMETEALPCQRLCYRSSFSEAGIHVWSSKVGYTVVSSSKGGAFLHSNRNTGQLIVNAGVVCRDLKGRLYSTHIYHRPLEETVANDCITITTHLYLMRPILPSPWSFLVLRILNLTVMRNRLIKKHIKRMLVGLLLNGGKCSRSTVRRTIRFGDHGPQVNDELLSSPGDGLSMIEVREDFCPIHMASKGYWQLQDDKYPRHPPVTL